MRTLTATTEIVSLEATPTATQSGALSKTDLIIGTIIALVMATAFTLLSSGLSLIVTFVPGIVVSWLTYVWLYLNKRHLPSGVVFLPVFFVALAVQFIHFAEEFTTGFRSSFPLLYGGTPYSADLFRLLQHGRVLHLWPHMHSCLHQEPSVSVGALFVFYHLRRDWKCHLSHMVEPTSTDLFPWSCDGPAVLDRRSVRSVQTGRRAKSRAPDNGSICPCLNPYVDHLRFEPNDLELLRCRPVKPI